MALIDRVEVCSPYRMMHTDADTMSTAANAARARSLASSSSATAYALIMMLADDLAVRLGSLQDYAIGGQPPTRDIASLPSRRRIGGAS